MQLIFFKIFLFAWIGSKHVFNNHFKQQFFIKKKLNANKLIRRSIKIKITE
jgi:hypothetical protein